MSESVDEGYPEPGPNLPIMAPNLDFPPAPPSSRSYESWAASCPEHYLEFGVGVRAVHARAKLCPFCGRAIRCPSSDQSLVEHMKSNECKTVQWELEAEAHRSTETELSNTEPDAAPSPIPEYLLTEPVHLEPAPHLEPAHSGMTHSEPLPCQGAELVASRSLWSNYPWQLHDPAHGAHAPLPFHICSINLDGNIVRIRSRTCAGVIPRPGDQSCDACASRAGSQVIQSVVERAMAETPTNGLQIKYYSFSQLAKLVATKDAKLKKYRLKGLEINRNAQRLFGQVSDHKQFMFALAASDDVAVARLVRVALRSGSGVRAIVTRLGQAQQGLYHCKSYSKQIIDVGLLVLRMSGPRLLFALSKAVNLPSLSTVYRHSDRSYLRPSIAFPTMDEALANIKSICWPAQVATPGIRGFSVMIDEIALEERLRYSIAEDSIVGICREHASICETQNMTGCPISHLMELKKLLDSGECHRAKEATLIALAPFGYSNYGPMVILISGTCKTEAVEGQTTLLSLVLDAWKQSPYGESALGSVWSIATDGDPRRRKAIHHLCMSHALPPTSPIYHELCNLTLLNTYCGADDVTHDGDFKHEEKRLASVLRSDTGVFINGMHISPTFTKMLLRLVPNMSPSRLDSLFDNSDRQNVPKANSLLNAIYEASQLQEICAQTAYKPFVLLGELLYSFSAPHTTPSMSLSQQVVCLSECAHILFALFRIDGAYFIPSQLYYDIQASIKNALFCIAKTKVLDPNLPFYLIQTGDDRLENRFGIYRTAQSDRNADLLQMAERSAAAQQIDNILAENPAYDRTPYRLSLEGESGIDHINPSSWVGDVCVRNIVLRSSWAEGRSLAVTSAKPINSRRA